MNSESDIFSDIYKGTSYSVVIIGASNVGKTALVYRYVINELPPVLTSTVGVEFTKRIITQKSTGNRIQLHIWDTAGQEKFKSVTKHYYRGTDICLLAFDLSDLKSFTDLDHWMAEVKSNAPDTCIVICIGNKADLANRVIDQESGKRFSDYNSFLYFETSALWDRKLEIMNDGLTGGIESILEIVIDKINKNQNTKEEFVCVNEVKEKKNCEC